ncbi:FtsX-like permease family protein [Pedococcus sp. 5OH_020]|uniref:FtsX-like permease family protein n=1 Tax=Pedococcus sp. 5OH_020 TaxID=2989814 RepID=UPI0022E9DFD3|nr:FtsX-like permease family protein [Pedococcus sp. 5OH_020]
MWAAIRYRRAQAAFLVLLSTLVSACAAFAPLYQRSLEQALLRTALSSASVADTALVVRGGRGPANPSFTSAALEASVPQRVRALYRTPIGAMTDSVEIRPAPNKKPSPATLVSRDRVCEHLRIVPGTCPSAKDEVLVSRADLRSWDWKLGQVLATPVPGAGGAAPALTRNLKIVGAYEVLPAPAYWMRTRLDGKSGTPLVVGTEVLPGVDDLVTSEATFDSDWRQAQATLAFPLDRRLFTLDSLGEISELLHGSGTSSRQGIDGALVETRLPVLIDGIRVGQQRLQVIVPLLMAQLGLLAAAVLLLVAQAAVEQRRPEAALARLRGHSSHGAARLVRRELTVTVALGLPLGFALAVVLTAALRRVVLPAGVPFEVPWQSLAGLATAALVCVVMIRLAASPVQRLTISALLRRVGGERRRRVGLVDALAVALAAFGVIGLGTGSLQGPLALMTPTLVALAAGLVTSRLVVPVVAASGRANVRRGRVGAALTAFGLERRPALRTVVTVVSVAVALTVFAANAVVVGERNWTARAQLETGAPVMLDTDSRSPTALLSAVRRVDPSGDVATPVAVVRRTDPGSTATLAVVSGDFDGLAFQPRGTTYRLGALAPPDVASVQLRGTRVTGRITWDLAIPAGETVQLPSGQSGRPRPPVTEPGGDPSELRIRVTTPDGQRLTRLLAQVPLQGKGSADLDAPLLCPRGCRLDGLEFRKTAELVSAVTGRLTITGLGLDGRSLRLSSPRQWNRFTAPATSSQDTLRLLPSRGDTIALEIVNTGFSVELDHADVPAVLPGLLAGPVPPGGSVAGFQALGVNGTPVTVSAEQTVPALPVLGGQGVLVDYETLARLGGTLPDTGRLSVWVGSPADADRVSAGLAAQGVTVLGRHSEAESKARLDESAAARGLRLAVFTGVMAVLLAGLVVIVLTVTGWRVVARDMAALHLSGVPLAVLRRALVAEHVVPVVVGAVVGLVCGLVSSVLAMPLVPLFDSAADPVPPLDLGPALPAVAAVALLVVGVLVAVACAAALGAGRRIALRRIRDSL